MQWLGYLGAGALVAVGFLKLFDWLSTCGSCVPAESGFGLGVLGFGVFGVAVAVGAYLRHKPPPFE